MSYALKDEHIARNIDLVKENLAKRKPTIINSDELQSLLAEVVQHRAAKSGDRERTRSMVVKRESGAGNRVEVLVSMDAMSNWHPAVYVRVSDLVGHHEVDVEYRGQVLRCTVPPARIRRTNHLDCESANLESIRRRITRLTLTPGLPVDAWQELCSIDLALSDLIANRSRP